MAAEQLAIVTQEEAEQDLCCPFCGSNDLTTGLWSLDEGEVDSIECKQCYAAAPKSVWNDRA